MPLKKSDIKKIKDIDQLKKLAEKRKKEEEETSEEYTKRMLVAKRIIQLLGQDGFHILRRLNYDDIEITVVGIIK